MASDARLYNLQWSVYTIIFIVASSVTLGLLARFTARLFRLSASEQRKIFWGFTFAGPWIVGFIIFVLGPALASLYYSFTDYTLGKSIKWAGLDNYRTLLLSEGRQGRMFNTSMLNSFYYALLGVPLQIAAALGMALLLNREIPGIRVFRMIFYMPVILAGGPAILLAWRYMLASNGGFVNEASRQIANIFSGFDYLYRLWIYLMEAFNGFYIGVMRGDALGPLKYTIPAVLAALLLLVLARGEWSESKRVLAWRSAQILGIAVMFRLMSKGLVAQPIDPSWIYGVGIAALVGMLTLNFASGRQRAAAHVLILGALAVVGVFALKHAGFALGAGETWRYLIPLLLVVAPLVISLVGPRTPQTARRLWGAAGVLSAILLVRLAWGQFGDGRLEVLTRYLTLGSTIERPADLDYLQKTYPTWLLSALWFYGAAIAVLLGAALLGERHPRARRRLLRGGLLVFALLAVSSFSDGRRYFQAFLDIAEATGKPNYHFALFHDSLRLFPDRTRVPLWMNSELWSKPSLILITMWSSGTGMLIFLAALKNVPQSLYEAAEVDGANIIQRFFKITLPMISPAMFYNIVIGVIAALQTFETVYILQTPLTRDSLSSAAFLLYARTFQELRIGEGAAMSWILVVIILTLTVLQFRFSRSWVHYEA